MKNKTDLRSKLEVVKLCPTIGAEVLGLDLSNNIDNDIIEIIRNLLLKHKVIFFRNQRITRDQHLNFARLFGEIHPPPAALAVASHPQISRVYYGPDQPPLVTNDWHSDWTELERPTMGTVLRAVEVPETGGDTLFADMITAYNKLPEKVKNKIDGLIAIHDSNKYNEGIYNGEISVKFEHPVVRTHPETGEKILYVNSMAASHIKNMDSEESKELLTYLCEQAMVPEYQVRFKWDNNSIAFWDNRSTQHYASADYWPAVRKLEAVSIAGDVPY